MTPIERPNITEKMTLPYDYARCTNETCPLAISCRRKEPGRTTNQAYAAFRGRSDCHGYIEKDNDDD